MQCPACRHENPAQAKFCLECGARLVVSCAHCGTERTLTAISGKVAWNPPWVVPE